LGEQRPAIQNRDPVETSSAKFQQWSVRIKGKREDDNDEQCQWCYLPKGNFRAPLNLKILSGEKKYFS
jgi:hypothetical protein